MAALGLGEIDALGKGIGPPASRLGAHVVHQLLEFGGCEPGRMCSAPCGDALARFTGAAAQMVCHQQEVVASCVVIRQLGAVPGGEQALEFGASQARHAERLRTGANS